MRLLTWNCNGIKTLLQYHPWREARTYEGIMEMLGADIICLQETKITRAQMDKSMAVMENWEGFFSFFCRSVKGIHGTAILTKSETTVPLKAEEGLGTSLLPAALTEQERIGGYPLGSDVDLTYEEMKDLDAEGRTTVCDFGMFVLINLYCPNETNDDRLIFKNYFNLLVDQRARNLIKAGREVIVVGDLNICAEAIDSAEADQRVKDQGLKNFSDHPPRAWLKEFVGPPGPMIDITRRLHPNRRSMFTCWNTKIDARPSNYGTRLDYILITPGLLPWVRDSNIQAEVMGSDHCPVFVDFHDEIEIEGRGKVKLWDELNVGRQRDGSKPEPPAFATRKYKEFSGSQKNLMSFFGKGSAASAPPASAPARASPSDSPVASTSQIQSTKQLSSSAPAPLKVSKSSTGASTPMSTSSSSSSSSKWKGKEKEVEVKPKGGQQSISSFFQPPPKPKPVKKGKEGGKKKKDAAQTPSPAPKRAADGEGDGDGSDLEIMMSADDFEATASSNADAKSAWSNLFQTKPPPLCAGHNEPTKLWTVNKSGINKGRRFFMCQRPVGPGYDKGQAKLHVNTEFRCDFFQWETQVKRPAGMNLDGWSAKKQKA